MLASTSPGHLESSSWLRALPEGAVEVLQDRLLAKLGALPPTLRPRHLLQALDPVELNDLLTSLNDSAVLVLRYDWQGVHARDNQLLPADFLGPKWRTILALCGRGWGKTRFGAEAIRYLVEHGLAPRIALIGPTAADTRDTMVEGESGLLACCPPWVKAHYEPSKRRVVWKRGGHEIARATLFSGEEPERLRGPQHHVAWGDEPASWPDGEELWAQLQLGLRLGPHPRSIVTGTPKPVKLILDLIKDPRTFLIKGATRENVALTDEYHQTINAKYAGTRIGRQELEAEILEAVAGIFDMAKVEAARLAAYSGPFDRIVVAVDPSQNSNSGNDETGIMVVGVANGHGYVLEDASIKGTPDEWARRVAEKFHEWQADSVVAEVNVGGEMVEFTLRTVDSSLPVKTVRAMRGKAKRAEPIAALFEQGKIHLVGKFEKLERQMRTFTGLNGKRDDRTDAMCWGFHELLVTPAFAFV